MQKLRDPWGSVVESVVCGVKLKSQADVTATWSVLLNTKSESRRLKKVRVDTIILPQPYWAVSHFFSYADFFRRPLSLCKCSDFFLFFPLHLFHGRLSWLTSNQFALPIQSHTLPHHLHDAVAQSPEASLMENWWKASLYSPMLFASQSPWQKFIWSFITRENTFLSQQALQHKYPVRCLISTVALHCDDGFMALELLLGHKANFSCFYRPPWKKKALCCVNYIYTNGARFINQTWILVLLSVGRTLSYSYYLWRKFWSLVCALSTPCETFFFLLF